MPNFQFNVLVNILIYAQKEKIHRYTVYYLKAKNPIFAAQTFLDIVFKNNISLLAYDVPMVISVWNLL